MYTITENIEYKIDGNRNFTFYYPGYNVTRVFVPKHKRNIVYRIDHKSNELDLFLDYSIKTYFVEFPDLHFYVIKNSTRTILCVYTADDNALFIENVRGDGLVCLGTRTLEKTGCIDLVNHFFNSIFTHSYLIQEDFVSSLEKGIIRTVGNTSKSVRFNDFKLILDPKTH